MADTSIQWTDKVWNPLRGCTDISRGCAHCYAATLAARFSGPGQPYEGLARFDAHHKAHWTGEVRLAEGKLAEPLKWRRPSRVFVNSMSDLFHESVPDEWIDQVFAIMAACPQHTFQVLTKRSKRMADYLATASGGKLSERLWDHWPSFFKIADVIKATTVLAESWPLPNLWPGVSVEDQERANDRILHLLRCPAAVRFLSVEPMLSAIDLTRLDNGGGETFNALTAEVTTHRGHTFRTSDSDPISWVIVGGESGPHARPFDLAWARSIRDQCKAAGISYFLKQLGARPMTTCRAICLADRSGPHSPYAVDVCELKLKDSHGGDETEWPEDLRGCRAFPRSGVAIG